MHAAEQESDLREVDSYDRFRPVGPSMMLQSHKNECKPSNKGPASVQLTAQQLEAKGSWDQLPLSIKTP
jgi:hypothetical protein